MRTLKEIALDAPEQTMLEPHVAHYCEVYDQFFEAIRQDKIRFLLIGIGQGGCLQTWKDYFPNAEIFAMDIRPECKEFEAEGIEVHIGDQGDSDFINGFLQETGGKFDIIIDDGGHQMYQQINSFLLLWNSLNPEGVYVIENTHTSYWPHFGGSIHGPNMRVQTELGGFQIPQGQHQVTTIDLVKALVDNLHAIHTTRPSMWSADYTDYFALKESENPYADAPVVEPIDGINDSLESMHLYDSLVVMVRSGETGEIRDTNR